MNYRLDYTTALILLVLVGCGSFFDKDQIEIKKVIRWYDEALVKVYVQSDIKPLDGLASEREMLRVKMMIAKFDREKKIMDSELVDLEFTSISIDGADKAKIKTREKWRYRFFRKGGNRVIKPWADVEYRMIYDMAKYRGRWIVGLVSFADEKD